MVFYSAARIGADNCQQRCDIAEIRFVLLRHARRVYVALGVEQSGQRRCILAVIRRRSPVAWIAAGLSDCSAISSRTR